MSYIRYALRSFTRQPASIVLAVLAMTIGIGANTAVFSVVHALLLKPLPYTDPNELVFITEVQRGTANSANVSPANYADYRNAKSFNAMGAAETWGATLSGFDAPEQIPGLRLTASVFEVLGVTPAIGRVFTVEEERPGNHRVVVLTHGLWMRRFGGDLGIVGQTIQLSGESWQVVGVMPPEFRFAPFWATNAAMFAPLSLTDAQRLSRGARTLRVFARLSPGVTPRQGVQELAALFDRSAQNTGLEPSVTPLNEMVVGKVRTPIIVLLAAVGFVLVIACANVATLLLVRALGRRQELAIRLSLGGTRWELLRLSLTESVLLSVAGGVLGLLLASLGIDALSDWFKSSMPRHDEIGIGFSIILFTAGMTFLTALVLSVVGALQVPFADPSHVLKESARSVGASTWSHRVRRGLVVAQVGLSLVLLIGAGLLTRSLLAIQAIDPGLRADGVNTAVLHAWGTNVSERSRQMNFYSEVEDRLRAAGPSGLINHVPLAGDVWTLNLQVEGRPDPPPGQGMGAVYRVATAGYFEAMGVRAVQGRVLARTDVQGAPLVAVVNQALARKVWPGENPVGKRLKIADSEFMTVCGVVADVVQGDWIAPRSPEVYLPLAQHPTAVGRGFNSSMTVVTRANVDLRRLVSSIEASVPVGQIQTMEDVVARATQRSRVYAALLGVFASSAVLLALIGLYGLVSSDVTRRTREIGVRTALGARPKDILSMVVREAMLLSAVGLMLGLVGSLALSRVLESMLYEVKPADAATMVSAVLLFLCITAGAAALAGRRAAWLDPVRALRD